MKITVVIITVCFILITIAILPLPADQKNFPANFKEDAFKHIEHICSLGIRSTGTPVETKTIEYVAKQLEKTGLKVNIEWFEFTNYAADRFTLHAAGKTYSPTMVLFNPYLGIFQFQGELCIYDPDTTDLNKTDIRDKMLLTVETANPFALMGRNPQLVIMVTKTDFDRLKSQMSTAFKLDIQGKMKKYKSANVVGILAPGKKKEIILCAHLDAYDSPGAGDNASGLGVMLELARYFKTMELQLPCQLKFIALGAEEIGALGSRIYLEQHKQDLKNCELVFNIDNVGGTQKIAVETKGSMGGISPVKGETQFPAYINDKGWDGANRKWKILCPALIKAFTAADFPDWLCLIIKDTVKELKYDARFVGPLGGDGQIFAQAGIASTSILIKVNEAHTLQDTPDKVVKKSLEKAGKLIAFVVLKTMNRLR
ncbi:MAG: M20/M25/M40 family metallo-hydrolase [Candidatus Aminicenantes bacterium]|nr:M20/M25/M40 family metallo-hydrolase [Candidatus Aminicenantes bacterium]NIM82796.1 M20/M25/M40 family metallo-hydrolase [Candidatus Aminicenantes bacterium]NIN22171.1 M20/M25/M40 family metallo-hydrolase [Candidatus Aminicenantes bacterium]NIN41168.1 M20/M25/M40 family metallo-hydrolase [Candidatus Aminicenantes bacterium]NIN88767.1 M20/M25/M40 family metallo-hydrolase [Candidatus Aminicenantes bacterium]